MEGRVFSKWPTLDAPTEAAATTTGEGCLIVPITIPQALLFLLRWSVDGGRKRDWCFLPPKTRTGLIPELTNPSMKLPCFPNPIMNPKKKKLIFLRPHQAMTGKWWNL